MFIKIKRGVFVYFLWLFLSFLQIFAVLIAPNEIDISSFVYNIKQSELTVSSLNPLPNFSKYTDVKIKKARFFTFLKPIIDDENNQITALRERIIEHNKDENLRDTDLKWLHMMGRDYRCINSKKKTTDVVMHNLFDCLIMKVDIVPASLTMAQAANESAWGTSRFAQKGNNLFGMWCHKPGCGIVPRQRGANSTHEVAKYSSIPESVQKYMRHINKHKNYKMLRDIRARFRSQNKKILGGFLANGLKDYSARGEIYVNDLMSIIRINKLHQYD